MSDDKGSKNRHITVLQDIVLNRNFTHPVLQKLQSGYEEKNTFKSTTGTKRRYTDSVYMFDEEPVFSDSDTEIEYHKIVMASMPNAKEYLQGMNESRQSNIVEDQSNLTSEEMKILKFIRTCSVTDIENVNDDFKQFVDLCKQLQSKYPLPKFGDESPESVRVSNQLCNKISTTEPYIANECQEGFLPSRSGSVTAGVLIGSVASLKNRHTKGTNGTDKKKHREKTNIQEHHVTSVTRRKAQITALQKGGVDSVKRKLRRLYSPEEWLHSEEISHLCKMNETMNRKSL
ncbi:hypothetical protein NQ315_001916 [Exocentrus adspersus]|uniref:Uncharacterized protein n=1 Tax=Exocentrus adspersus TaxID=1586481 RepID=A0AAV8WAL3_9CUCU|nr:hypothetical protein NQ315_001916 [Exocentrus adspersus]